MLQRHEDVGDIETSAKLLYPSIALFTQTQTHFICEFFGAQERYYSLKEKRHKESSTERYFNQFDENREEPLFVIEGEGVIISDIKIAKGSNLEALKTRFPSTSSNNALVFRNSESGSLVLFGSDKSLSTITRCIFINKKENITRCKNILMSHIVSKNATKKDLLKLYRQVKGQNRIVGVYEAKQKSHKAIHNIGQLQGMYLLPSLRETTIGEFIRQHPDIINNAFDSDSFVYEPYLEWKENSPTDGESAINPDIMLKRKDGKYDILDLKTALLNRASLTKGGNRRRRFVDAAYEGAAQLANYKEYFDHPKNADHAKEKYGIEVDNPRLILIVGNYDNTDVEEVRQAARSHKDIEFIDYDTLCQLYLEQNL